jgi:glycerol-3-phosphate acyltransferase PlsX
MSVGLKALANGEADAFVSAGNTGALITGATIIVRRILGINRAAIASILPLSTPVLLMDSGANLDCRPEMLYQFARMGSVYMSKMMKNGEPATVGLLNVGTEEHKGGDLQHETYALLKDSDMAFVGNVEAREVPNGVADVVVADGFAGNVLLKGMEGTIGVLMGYIKEMFYTNFLTKIAALIVKPYIGNLKKKFSTSEHVGAPLLGVAHPVLKAHGNSKALAIPNAVRVAAEFAQNGIIDIIADSVKKEKDTDGTAPAPSTAE